MEAGDYVTRLKSTSRRFGSSYTTGESHSQSSLRDSKLQTHKGNESFTWKRKPVITTNLRPL